MGVLRLDKYTQRWYSALLRADSTRPLDMPHGQSFSLTTYVNIHHKLTSTFNVDDQFFIHYPVPINSLRDQFKRPVGIFLRMQIISIVGLNYACVVFLLEASMYESPLTIQLYTLKTL